LTWSGRIAGPKAGPVPKVHPRSRNRETCSFEHDALVGAVHPVDELDVEVTDAGEARVDVRAQTAEHDARAEVGAEDRNGVRKRAQNVRIADVERFGRRVPAVISRRDERRSPCHRACIDIGDAKPYSVTAMTTNFTSPQELLGAVGTELGVTDWVTITQDQIDKFAEATLDNQWIHVDTERAKAGPFGTPIAHGFLTMSLAAHFLAQLVHVSNISMGINYGVDKVRFPAPVPVNSRVRARGELLDAKEVPGGVQATTRVTIEREGGDKPVAIVDTISRYMS
jgi:acyl dehydratase